MLLLLLVCCFCCFRFCCFFCCCCFCCCFCFCCCCALVWLHQQVIVFFPTAKGAQFHAALARASGLANALDLHSRLSQKQRDTAIAAFAGQQAAVMFASDVLARGIDVPDVSLVVQVGVITNGGLYVIHR